MTVLGHAAPLQIVAVINDVYDASAIAEERDAAFLINTSFISIYAEA